MKITRTDLTYNWYLKHGFPVSEEDKNSKTMSATILYKYFKYENVLPKDILERVENGNLDYHKFKQYINFYLYKCITGDVTESVFYEIYQYDISYNFNLGELKFVSYSLTDKIPFENVMKYIGKNYSERLLFKIERGLSFGLDDVDIQHFLLSSEIADMYMTKKELDLYCREIIELLQLNS